MVTAVSTMSDQKYAVTTAAIIAKKMDSLVKMILNSISKIMLHYENTAESDLKNGTGGRKRKSNGFDQRFRCYVKPGSSIICLLLFSLRPRVSAIKNLCEVLKIEVGVYLSGRDILVT